MSLYHRLHDRFGMAGVVLGAIALILALGGSALAASKLTNPEKKEVAKIAKKEAQKYANSNPGPEGKQGTAGGTGPAGKDGSNGTNGISPVGTEFSGSKDGHCNEGGVEFAGTNKTFACNGKKGTNGLTGFTETLPPGKTETGIFGTNLTYEAAAGSHPAVISFPIPLASRPTTVIVPNDKESEPGCPGRGGGEFPPEPETVYVPATPEADPGFLCVYIGVAFNTQFGTVSSPAYFAGAPGEEGAWAQTPGASTAGGILGVRCPDQGPDGPNTCVFQGTWAVTGAEE